ncbi:MAG: SAM-dependent methyltransferase [Planctomycetaceae bacterium]|nr:SAM-dependent methyltransferase [Planctomycetaceae bacterium]
MPESESTSLTPRDEFQQEFGRSLEAGTFVSLTLNQPAKGRDLPAKQVVRPVTVRDELLLQWTVREGTQEKHRNRSVTESRECLSRILPDDYRQATLSTTQAEWQFRQGKRRDLLQKHQRSRPAPEVNHNREKQYLIPEGTPAPFLVELGVMTPEGRVKADRFRKFRQINRYLEFVEDIYRLLPESGPIHVTDFGCGLSYLTFALHHLLHVIHGREVELVGIDRNESVTSRAAEIAQRLGLSGLKFSSSEVSCHIPSTDLSHITDSPLHLAVSLHACDTATDATLIWAVQAKAAVILAVPCCQHELAPQLHSTALELFQQHGILREQFSSLATDALRSAALEAAGYQTQVVEFIDLEHTPKNLLLRAFRRDVDTSTDARCLQARRQFEALKTLLGVQTLAIEPLLPPLN